MYPPEFALSAERKMRLLMLVGLIAAALCVNGGQISLNVTKVLAQNAPLTDCDQLAANPIDPQRKATGFPLSKIDTSTAIPACETAVRQYPNDAQLNYQLGRAYFGAKNYQAAVDQFEKAAQQGYAPAQFALGTVYRTGHGAAKDDAEAVTWYRTAAERGYAPAQDYLGSMYQNGRGVAQDDAEAVSWYRKAAEQGYAPAQTNLGSMYLRGQGVAKDDAEAVSWYRKAADQGYAPAQGILFGLGAAASPAPQQN
jgi:TPR repeat protein